VDTTGTATTTYYLNDPISGLRAEKTVISGTTTWKDHLQAGGRMTGQRSKVGAAAATFQHFVLDHLGSVAVTTDAEGNNVCRLRYDPWGKRVGSAACSPTTRGFTDHEMIDAWGLVNMNARVYDATLGRFMSVDPITATQFDPQSLNKYSYVSNNPLRFIDPTGMVAEVLVTAPISANTPPPKIGQGYVDVGGYHQGRGYSDKKEVFNNKATANYMALNKQWGEFKSGGAGKSAQGKQDTGSTLETAARGTENAPVSGVEIKGSACSSAAGNYAGCGVRMVEDASGNITIYVPVELTSSDGSMSSADLTQTLKDAIALQIETTDGKISLQIEDGVASNDPGRLVLDLTNGGNTSVCGALASCLTSHGSRTGYVDSSRSDVAWVVAHEGGHAAHLIDRYSNGVPHSGYETNIMARSLQVGLKYNQALEAQQAGIRLCNSTGCQP